jgi:hypothetical protein
MKEFNFSFAASKSSFQTDGITVNFKSGPIIKKNFLFSNIQHYYLKEDRGTLNFDTLYLTYTNDAGKQKSIQMISDPTDSGFVGLKQELQEKIAHKGLNHLSSSEAFKVMKTMNPKIVGALATMIVVVLLMSVILYPGLRHYFDFGFASGTVAELIAGKDFGTRNLKLSGVAGDYVMEEITTSKKNSTTTTSKSYFTPLVEESWDETKPVLVLLKFDEDMTKDESTVGTEFKGVVRNIAWEGTDDEYIEFYRSDYGLNMSEDVILFEVTGKEHNDAFTFWIWLGFIGFFAIIMGIFVLKK